MTASPAIGGTDSNRKGRIWGGDRSVVAEQRRLFNAGKLGFVAWVSTLYSFRKYPNERQELIHLAPKLLEYANSHFHPARGEASCADTADEADVVSRILVWLRGATSYCFGMGSEYTDAALHTLEFGKRMVGKDSKHHTHAFLLLTQVDILLRYRSRKENTAKGLLYRVESFATDIGDPNQRARVFRDLGRQWRAVKNTRKSRKWFWKAFFASGIARSTRVKSLAAWIGIGD